MNEVSGRQSHTATLLDDGTVFVAGGFNRPPSVAVRVTKTTETFNPATGLWTTRCDMTSRRYLHTATKLSSGKVLLVGGNDTVSQDTTIESKVGDPLASPDPAVSSADIYDPSTSPSTCTATGTLTARLNHTATLLTGATNNGDVLAVGGASGEWTYYPPWAIETASQVLDSAEVYDGPDGAVNVPPPSSEENIVTELSWSAATPGCTSGFTVHSSATGQYYGTTAGHCGPTGTEVHVGDDHLSNVGTNTYQAGFVCAEGGGAPPAGTLCIDADSSRYYISSSHKTARIYTAAQLDAPGGHRTVTGKLSNTTLNTTKDFRVCFQGITSGADNCGWVRSWTRDKSAQLDRPPIPPRFIRHEWCFVPDGPHALMQGGDSGGPVYRVNADDSATAAGLVLGNRSLFNEDTGQEVLVSCFSSIDNVLAGLNATLVTG